MAPRAEAWATLSTVDVPSSLHARFRPLAPLGAGGFGSVWRCQDTELGRPLALKLLQGWAQDSDLRARFTREAQLTAALRHPNIVQVYDHGVSAEGVPWIGYELVEGQPLSRRVGQAGADEVRAWARQAAEALAALHEVELVHRDVKPDNLVLRPDGQLVLIDLGIAGATRARTDLETLTAEGLILGTPAYMAPEVLAGQPSSPSSDQFSWAATFLYLGSGQAVYGSADPGEVFRSLPRFPAGLEERLAQLDAGLADALRPSLAARPPQRRTSMAACAAALANAQAPSPRAAPARAPRRPAHVEKAARTERFSPTTGEGARRSPRTPRRLVGSKATSLGTPTPPAARTAPQSRRALLGVLAAVVLALGWAWTRGRSPPTSSTSGGAPPPTSAAQAAEVARAAEVRRRILAAEARLRKGLGAPADPWRGQYLGPEGVQRLLRLTSPEMTDAWQALLLALGDALAAGDAAPWATLRRQLVGSAEVLRFLRGLPEQRVIAARLAHRGQEKSLTEIHELVQVSPALERSKLWVDAIQDTLARLDGLPEPRAPSARRVAGVLAAGGRQRDQVPRLLRLLRDPPAPPDPEADLQVWWAIAEAAGDDHPEHRFDCGQTDALLAGVDRRLEDLPASSGLLHLKAHLQYTLAQRAQTCEQLLPLQRDRAVAAAEAMTAQMTRWAHPRTPDEWPLIAGFLYAARGILRKPAAFEVSRDLRAALTRTLGAHVPLVSNPEASPEALAREIRGTLTRAERELRDTLDDERTLPPWSVHFSWPSGAERHRRFLDGSVVFTRWMQILGALAEAYTHPHAEQPALVALRAELDATPGLAEFLEMLPQHALRAASTAESLSERGVFSKPEDLELAMEVIRNSESMSFEWEAWRQAARAFAFRMGQAPPPLRAAARELGDLVLFTSRSLPEADQRLEQRLARPLEANPRAHRRNRVLARTTIGALAEGRTLNALSCERLGQLLPRLDSWLRDLPPEIPPYEVRTMQVLAEAKVPEACGVTLEGAPGRIDAALAALEAEDPRQDAARARALGGLGPSSARLERVEHVLDRDLRARARALRGRYDAILAELAGQSPPSQE